MNEALNAYEAWSLYDTVLIGQGMKDRHASWYNSFYQLGFDTDVSFFSQRSRSSVGAPYCNMDSVEQIPFVFHCYSIGVEWYAPILSDMRYSEGWIPSISINPQLFSELMKHASLRFQVSQDEKLLINVLGAPGGGGISGYCTGNNAASPMTENHSTQALGNGAPVLTNRWAFAEPVQIPRNRNISAVIEFSNYGKELLKQMVGPSWMAFDAETAEADALPTAYMMRVSMFGKREVQQRNQLHF